MRHERWPPEWLRTGYGHVKLAQLGLGHYEKFVADEDEHALEMARSVSDHFVATQLRDGGPHHGGWPHDFPFEHRAPLKPPWLSAMAQGQAASLLTRMFSQTGDERFAESAQLAMCPMHVSTKDGGVLGSIEGMPFPEEYPTSPESHVLNGAIFAAWGMHDVARSQGDPKTVDLHAVVIAGLRATCSRWDIGRWSRYDLFPYRPTNISSSFYHRLHISQFQALHTLYGHEEFSALAERFEQYERRRYLRLLALAQKVAYRLIVPRHKIDRDAST